MFLHDEAEECEGYTAGECLRLASPAPELTHTHSL